MHVLCCRVASGGDSAAVLTPITAAVAEAVVPHLASAYPASLRTATSQLLLSLAKLDADALWLLLFRLAQQVLYKCCFPNEDCVGSPAVKYIARCLLSSPRALQVNMK